MIWGKLIGAILGFFVAGPAGVVLGVLVGHYFDQNYAKAGIFGAWGGNREKIQEAQNAFFETTFLVMGHIAKADGRVSEKEINIARNIMQRMLLNAEQKRRAISLFNLGKQSDFDLRATLARFKQSCYNQTLLLRMFIEIQVQAAKVDGLSQTKQRILQSICANLGFTADFSQFGAYEYQQGTTGDHQRQQYRYTQAEPSYDPYEIIGVKRTATNAEVKRAYRKLMSQHHPDKLVSKGLPEEMMKIATERAQEIQKAYDEIKKSRRM